MANDKQYQEIEIAKIIIPEERSRATFTLEQEAELKASIEQNGFTIPILVRPVAEGKYELIDGEHRIKVVKGMGWTKIPAIITTTDEKRAAVLNFLANTARGTQNPIDISEALNRANQAGATIDELAAATGHTKDWVEFYLTLKKLPEVYYNALKNLELQVGAVKEAFRLPTPEDIDAILGATLLHKWPVSTVKIAVDNRLDELRLAREKAQELGEPTTAPEIRPEQLIQYDDCMICHAKVQRGQTWMKVICNPCLDLLKYLLSIFGDSKTAMTGVYEALKDYKEHQDYLRLKQKFEPEIKKEGTPPPSQPKTPFPISG
jgi:ParB family chromosome partitioning protein